MSATLTTADAETWTTSTGGVTICGVAYTATVTRTDCEGLCLTLTAPDGITTYPTQRAAVGKDWATFAVGDLGVCTGDPADCGRPSGNLATIRVEWACCDDPAGWDGPGWYCVRAAGSSDPCEPVELLEADRCDCEIEICSGPYEDEAAAAAVCPPPGLAEVDCGCVGPTGPPFFGTVSRYFTLTLSGVTHDPDPSNACNPGGCDQLNRTWVAQYIPTTIGDLGSSSPIQCVWRAAAVLTGCLTGGLYQVLFRRLCSGAVRLEFLIGSDVIVYEASAPTWDGKSAITLPFVSLDPGGSVPRCIDWPATVTLFPVT